jgi:hypothetical protein
MSRARAKYQAGREAGPNRIPDQSGIRERERGRRTQRLNVDMYQSQPISLASRTTSKTARRANLEMNLVQHRVLPLLFYPEHTRWHSYQCWISWKVMCDVRFPFHRPIIRLKQGRAEGTEAQSGSSLLQQAMQRGLDTSQRRIVYTAS